MHAADRYRLPHGAYAAPALKRGDRATCLFRAAEVIITSWSDGRIPWPRCRLPDTHGGGSGLLVDAELARAVRCESALAVRHWWGIVPSVVWRWRKALGVERFTEGSRQLRNALNAELAAGLKGKRQPREMVRRRMATKRTRGTQYIPQRWAETGWTAEQLALLGTLPDEQVAKRIGRTPEAVRVKRGKLRIPSARDRGRKGNRA
jgi:hypothetical protein